MAIQCRQIFPEGGAIAGVAPDNYIDLELEGDGKNKTVTIGSGGLPFIKAVIGCGPGANITISSDGRGATIEFEKPPSEGYKFHITLRGAS